MRRLGFGARGSCHGLEEKKHDRWGVARAVGTSGLPKKVEGQFGKYPILVAISLSAGLEQLMGLAGYH